MNIVKEKKFYDHILKNELYLPDSMLLLNYGNRNVITHIKVKLNEKVFIYLEVMTMHTDQRLMEAYENARVEYFDKNSRYVF